ncbi:NodT family efflux transporter outer membrane factor (OMF) lipoprotein [Novosphingobium hassiacum]|uniref:NodT family efflux transporter outer membrane factor (OMF) lipoprotein n=1 Tax=Novosphingobium hassiacum TaxID=173676 RepID=A0A7W5ZVU2_9SPHN|nr:efflux transporter outer membrane subunit [Novosphingobium hassiacum]MBB3860322.1 NodT family efflux transporter outer membrane factor (OMF) lipoprotein [Novosphingobium hassiacum]
MTAIRSIRPASLSLAVAALLSGCTTVGPDYAGAPQSAPQAVVRGGFLRGGDALVQAPAARWWESLNDAVLNQLVEAALADSPTLAAANARVAQSRASLAANKTAVLPTLGTSFSAPYINVPGNIVGNGSGRDEINAYNLGFDAGWEIDLFGGTRRKVEAASARAEAAEAGVADARVTLSAEIARAYVGLRARQAMQGLQQRQVAIDRALVGLARERLGAGTAPAQPLNAAEAQAFASEADLAKTGAEIVVLTDQLAVLTGKEPGALDGLLATPAPVPLPPVQVSIGDPALMLRSRPDIRVAERQLAAANADVGVQVAAKFPTISFLGILGLGGQNIGDVLDPSNIVGIALPRLKWSLFDGGRAERQVDAAKGAYAEAEANYRRTVLAALQDAEGSLARFGAQRVTFARTVDAEQRGQRTVQLQNQRLTAGTVGRSDALTSERQALQLSMAAAGAQADLTTAFVAVEKALGLGWQAAEAQK